MRRIPTTRRGGFTLVELLVAAALSLVVMTVLAIAFQTGMATLSQLKSVVGMAEQLRAAETVMRRDLLAYHLEADQNRPVRVSQGGHTRGYFSFIQGGMAQTAGGPVGAGPLDEKPGVAAADSPTSFRTQPASLTSQLYGRAWMDTVSFTVRLNGDRPQEVFTASAVGSGATTLLSRIMATDPSAVPPEYQSADPTNTQLASRWAEVTYLLVPSGPSAGTQPPVVFTSDEGGVTQLPLYTLYRRQRVLAARTVPQLNSLPILGGTATSSFTAADADASRGVAMAQPGGGSNPWVVLGPDGVAGTSNRAASDPLRAVEINAQFGNRLGGTNDQLAPAVSSAPSAMQSDLQRRGYPIPRLFAGNPVPDYGSDVLLNNVVSMTVRPVYSHDIPPQVIKYIQDNNLSNPSIVSPDGLTPTGSTFLSYSPRSLLYPNVTPDSVGGANTYSSPTQFPRFFDTAGGGFSAVYLVNGNQVTGSLTNFKLKAIEIKLRVYDSKNKTTRQMTVLVDL